MVWRILPGKTIVEKRQAEEEFVEDSARVPYVSRRDSVTPQTRMRRTFRCACAVTPVRAYTPVNVRVSDGVYTHVHHGKSGEMRPARARVTLGGLALENLCPGCARFSPRARRETSEKRRKDAKRRFCRGGVGHGQRLSLLFVQASAALLVLAVFASPRKKGGCMYTWLLLEPLTGAVFQGGESEELQVGGPQIAWGLMGEDGRDESRWSVREEGERRRRRRKRRELLSPVRRSARSTQEIRDALRSSSFSFSRNGFYLSV